MKARIILIILLAIAVIVSVLIIARASESSTVIDSQAETITNLEELVNRKDFAWAAADLEVDNLETTILSQNELILDLKVDQQALVLYKETLEYTFTYVYYAQALLYMNDIPHAEFIGETILEDSYFDELEDQKEMFEKVDNGS